MPVGALILGAGLMGRWHVHALRTLGVRVVAVVDVDAGRAKALASGVEAIATSDLALALEKAPLVAHLCVPPASQAPIARRALEAGVHLLVEKPFMDSPATAADILARAQAAGRLACPVHQFLFQRGMAEALRRLPDYGPLRHVDFVACSAGAEGPANSSGRRAQLVRDILPHPLSILRRTFDATLARVDWRVAAPREGEARISAVMRDVTVGILISASGRPTRNAVRFVGERGTMDVDLFHGFAALERGSVTRTGKILRPFAASAGTVVAAGTNLARRLVTRQPAYPGLRELISAFHDAAAHGTPAPIAPAETQDVCDATDIIAAMLPG